MKRTVQTAVLINSAHLGKTDHTHLILAWILDAAAELSLCLMSGSLDSPNFPSPSICRVLLISRTP